jgi:hypothetical protein
VCYPNQLAIDSKGNLWFTDLTENFVGQVTLNGFFITSLSPTTSAAGAATFNVTINGNGFVNGATAQLNGSTLLVTTFNNPTQLIAAMPANLGAATFNMSVINPGGAVSNSLPFTVTPPANTTISITTPTPLTSGVVGTAYSQTLAASGGTLPYTWRIVSGSLPAGLSLSPAGVISGIPTATGTQTFTVGLTDSAAVGASQSMTLTISGSAVFSSALRIPQILDGGGWVTGFSIVNIDQVPISFTFQFWDDSGHALAFPLLNGTPGILSGTLNPGASFFAQSAGSSPGLVQGWAEVASTGRIGVTGTFQLTSSGTRGQQAAVIGSASGSNVYMPFDNTQGNATAVAIANSNATQTLTVALSFVTDTGAKSTASITLPPKAHSAFVVPTAYPAVANSRGSINFSASSPDIAVTGLRFAPTVIGAITTLGTFQ